MTAPRARLAAVFLTLTLAHQLSILHKLILRPMPLSRVLLFPVQNLSLLALTIYTLRKNEKLLTRGLEKPALIFTGSGSKVQMKVHILSV